MKLDKEGIAVAEYWMQLSPKSKSDFLRKKSEIYEEAQERLERCKLLLSGSVTRQIDCFMEPKDDDE